MSVRFDGVDLCQAGPADIGGRIVSFAQETMIFHATLADNMWIAAPTADDETADAALRAVDALHWARSLPERAETQIGAGATDLSADERQLGGLDRLALLNPAAVVLDEVTAAFDDDGALTVERALREALADRTLLIIAQRPATARQCDRILTSVTGRLEPAPQTKSRR